MMCPLCKNECAEKDLNTFQDYADYLYAQLCIQTVKLVSGDMTEQHMVFWPLPRMRAARKIRKDI